MKKITPNFLIIILFATLVSLFSCKNELPEITIISPMIGEKYGLGETITVIVNANDADGQVSKIELFANDKPLSTITTKPFMCDWDTKNLTNTECVLEAIAYDDEGGSVSASIQVTFVEPPKVNTLSVKYTSPSYVVVNFEIEEFAEEIENSGFVVHPSEELFDDYMDFYDFKIGEGSSTGQYITEGHVNITKNLFFRAFAEDKYSTGYGNAIECPAVSMNEGFDDNANEWFVDEYTDDDGYLHIDQIQNGFYKLCYNRDNWYHWVFNDFNINLDKSYVIEANVQFNTGDDNNNSAFGLVYAITDDTDDIFYIREDNEFFIFSWGDDLWKIKDKTYSGSILQNKNKLQVFCFENGTLDDYYFFINGEQVYYYQGLMEGMYPSFGVSISQGEVWVDDFKISYLEVDKNENKSITLNQYKRKNRNKNSTPVCSGQEK